jgi:hypothetical protein
VWIDEQGNQADYTQGGRGSWKVISEENFRSAFKICMDGDDDNPKLRSNFTELVLDLTKISTTYRFNLPPYMVFIIRSLTTLDFAAARTNCNMYEVAAPTAIFRALSPRTPRGKAALEEMLLNADGELKWSKLMALSEQVNQASNTPGSESKFDSTEAHAREAATRLMNELFDSTAGSALRRVVLKAKPSGLIPPPPLRNELFKIAHASFARSMANFSFKTFFKAAFNSASARDSALDKRRRAIAAVLIKSKLFNPTGLMSFLSMATLLLWAAFTGIIKGSRTYLLKRIQRRGTDARS